MFKDGLKALEIVFKRFVFGLFSVFLTTGPRRAAGKQTPDSQKRERILFLRFDKLGDMIVSLSVFETLAQVAPQLEVEVLASPANCGIIAHDSRVKKIWLYSKRPWRDWKTLRVLRKRNYSSVVDMVCLDSVTSLFLSQYIGRRVERIGIGKKRFGKYYTGNVTLNESNYEHIIESSLRVLMHLGIAEEQFVHQAPLKLPKQAVADAESFVSPLKQGEPQALVVGVNISAGKPNRIWQENNYVALIDLLHESKTKPIIIILCAPNDREVALRICKNAGERVSLVPDGLNILQASAIIAKCDILITPDTSLVHIARQHEVPVVGLYPTDGRNSAQWRPHMQSDGMVQSGSDCHVHDIQPQDVYQEFMKVSARIQQFTS